ncbi:sulfurtransferase TusA family protein [Ureibacillus sp. Re31]|uniref:Sulfurtransferase TusA family protein n=1 Tax=Ureibacillus galli TaxID=2762222 RepID=A0ABR8XFK3_9BACL|nr:sulfurtransferase TusA family protein [Ureibacillus galli]MBD8028018.1 sulfurtransferase TusA family protein [Ureibacillus galli]
MDSITVLDVKGMSCPMPIVRTKKAMDTLSSGDILEVHTTDKGALADMPAWVNTAGHSIVEQKEVEDVLIFFIKKVEK